MEVEIFMIPSYLIFELCSVLNIIEQITIIGGLKRKCEDRNVYLKLSNSIF